jgi:hypothetical protein
MSFNQTGESFLTAINAAASAMVGMLVRGSLP